MFEHVLVGIDGRHGGWDALSLAVRLCPGSRRLTLAHVYPPQAYVWRGSNPGYEPRDRTDAQALLEAVRRQSELDAELRPVESQSVGAGLAELAEAVAADLLVVGSTRHGPLERVLLGDDAQAVLTHARSVVAIAPAGYADQAHPITRIGLGYDGSPESHHALEVARELGGRLGGQLSVFQVTSVPTRAVMAGQAPMGVAVDGLVGSTQRQLSELTGLETHVAHGRPGEELSSFSASVDLLIVGSRGQGPLGRLLHGGGTAARLARTTRCPLLVLKRRQPSAV